MGEGSAAGEWCPRDSDELSVGALETRGTVLEAASEVGLALSSAASVWSSVGAAREHRIFLLCESSSWPVRGKLAENPRSRPIVRDFFL